MGRYKYDRFVGCFSQETKNAIITDLVKSHNIRVDDYDWNAIDIRIKKANRAQRHRFADTIKRLNAFWESEDIRGHVYNIDGEIDACISVAHFSRITGRNRKTVADWIDKGFIKTGEPSFGQINIMVYKTIENLKKI